MTTPAPAYKWGIVKEVLSGDSVIIRNKPKGGPPPEKKIGFTGITAPKLARQKPVNQQTPNSSDNETKDEPYAWEAREFLRKKLVGNEVYFTSEKPVATTTWTGEYGVVYLGKDQATAENITESLVSEGLAKVRDAARNAPALKRLVELEEVAKQQSKGIWGTDLQSHVRDVKWNIENPKQFIAKHEGQRIKAIIEYVHDGSTIRALLLPEYYSIRLMIAGIRCPKQNEQYFSEARFFVESRLLQQDVEIVLESANNNSFVGTVSHPQGNIAESLLKEGFAKCLPSIKTGATQLRTAEKQAKQNKLRIWKDWQNTEPTVSPKDRDFQATVVEIINGDAMNVKLADGSIKKIFLASIKPPREKNAAPADEDGKLPPRPKGFKALYDIPWMFEAREFLRKKLIGKRVNVHVDYKQPANDNYPEKICCTINVGGINIAEALVSKGLGTVIRHRQDDDSRSSHYDKLLEAESKAIKSASGVHAKKDIPTHRTVADTSGDATKAKQFLPYLIRGPNVGIVDYVASGARLRLFIPKEFRLITFLLAGISCPRGARPGIGGGPPQAGEPYGEEALAFTKDKCLQREVTITVDGTDKAGNFIGWLFIENENLSVALVEAGLSSMHFSAETSTYYNAIKNAEEAAKKKQIGIWKDYVEVEKEKPSETDVVQERKIKHEKVVVTEVTNDGHFYAQNVENGSKLESLMDKIYQKFSAEPPLAGAYNPKKNEICAAKFSQDDQWYRAKVEKVQGTNVSVFYIDYGNREVVNVTRCAILPSSFNAEKPYATEYCLACVVFPNDEDYREDAVRALKEDILNKTLLLNVEIRGPVPAVTLSDPAKSDSDIGKALITEGLLLANLQRDRRLTKLIEEYEAAQEVAKKNRMNLWQHGDIRDDDAKEFGVSG